MIQSGHRPPALTTIEQQTCIMRAILRIRDKQFGQAFKILIRCWNPQSWRYALSWFRNKRHMGRCPLVQREVLWP